MTSKSKHNRFCSHKMPKYDVYSIYEIDDATSTDCTDENRGKGSVDSGQEPPRTQKPPWRNMGSTLKGKNPNIRGHHEWLPCPTGGTYEMKNSIRTRTSISENILRTHMEKSSFTRTSSHWMSCRSAKTPSHSASHSRPSHSASHSRPSNSKTPASTRSHMDGIQPSTVVAVVEGRGQARREVGMAAIDLHRPLLTLVQFSDTHTYIHTITNLSILNPLDVVFAATAEGDKLMSVIKESLERVCISTVQRKYFNETRGLAILKQLAAPQSANFETQITSKYYCLSAVAALMQYVEQIQRVTYPPRSLIIKISSSDLTMMMDYATAKNLELVRSLTKGWEHSLFGAIRHTNTYSGTRLLRASLLQPFADLKMIESRVGALEYLTQNAQLFHTLTSILGRFPDLDWILSMCIQRHIEDNEFRCEQRLNYIIGLKNTLDLLHPLKMALEEADNPLFTAIKESIAGDDIEELATVLRKVIHEDARLVKGAAAMRTQRCYAIKSNINGLLDVARKIYSEIIDDIADYIKKLSEDYDLPMRFGHNSTKGFHVIIPVSNNGPKPALPNCFIHEQHCRGSISCTTEEVYQLDQRSKEVVREILIMSNVIILQLMDEVKDHIGALYGVAEAIADLDLVVGLAHTASIGNWVRPKFSWRMEIKGGRHAILDLLSAMPPVPNDTKLNPEKRALIITGANMSGKSTYLKQVALIQILAQIGSFVPAASATLMPKEHLFTLFGCEDNAENNASTFQVQMNQIALAMEMCGKTSLIILDELGQGTNLEEGTSLAWAIIEGFLASRAFLITATHMFPLTWMERRYPQITNCHMEAEITKDQKLQMTHILREGVATAFNYGLALAEKMPLPKKIIEDAKEISKYMELKSKIQRKPTDFQEDDSVYILAHKLLAFAASVPDGAPSEEELIKINFKEILQEFLHEQKSKD